MIEPIQIEIINAVACRIERRHAHMIASAISFTRSYWVQTPRGKRQKIYEFTFWLKKTKGYHFFLTGYLPKVLALCRQNNFQVKVTGNRPSNTVPVFASPRLPGITFRPDQNDAIETAITRKRGIIKAPTRTGKTIIQFGIVSGTKANVLFLAHTVDLVQQLADEGRKFGFNVHEVHGTSKDLSWDKNRQNVIFMVRKTADLLFKQPGNAWMSTFFGVIILDECHHLTSDKGEYPNIFKFIEAPLRFGFTATLPQGEEALSCLTGFIGPLIYELGINEAVEKDLLVKPKIILIKPPIKKVAINTKYDDVYQKAIVDHMGRHDLIADTARNFISQGKSVLILVNRLDHGAYQQYALERVMPDRKFPFIHGESDHWERENVKKGIETKKFLCVVVSTIWKEGINIPSLDVCINAAGGVSEIAVLQSIGRSLTKAEGKNQAIIVDVFDQSHTYLIRHFGNRICLYMDQGWI